MSVDRFLTRRRTPEYDCAAFAAEVYLAETGIDADRAAPGLLRAQFAGKIPRTTRRGFREISAPTALCFVIMRRPRSPLHVGIFIRGRVLHLKQNGVEYQPLHVATRTFTKVQFAVCN
jgi:hypothetical protein